MIIPFNESEIRLLKENDWELSEEHNGMLSARNNITGDYILSEFSIEFLKEKIEEINEDNKPLYKIDTESLFKKHGYLLECESPLEVRNSSKDEFLSGECALWLKSVLLEKERQT